MATGMNDVWWMMFAYTVGVMTAVTFSPGSFLFNIQVKYFHFQLSQVLKASPKVNVVKRVLGLKEKGFRDLFSLWTATVLLLFLFHYLHLQLLLSSI